MGPTVFELAVSPSPRDFVKIVGVERFIKMMLLKNSESNMSVDMSG